MRRLGGPRLSRATAQECVPVAIAMSDVAAAERSFRAIIDLIVHPAVVGTVVDCVRDVEAAMIAESARQVPGALPLGMDERPMDRRIAWFGRAAGGCPRDACQESDLSGLDRHVRDGRHSRTQNSTSSQAAWKLLGERSVEQSAENIPQCGVAATVKAASGI